MFCKCAVFIIVYLKGMGKRGFYVFKLHLPRKGSRKIDRTFAFFV